MSEVRLSHVPDAEFSRREREAAPGQGELDRLRRNDTEAVARAAALFGWGDSV